MAELQTINITVSAIGEEFAEDIAAAIVAALYPGKMPQPLWFYKYMREMDDRG